MPHRSTRRITLVAAGVGLLAIIASPPAGAVLLAIGGAVAARGLVVGTGAARIMPAVVLSTIVVGGYYAPVKHIELAKARRLTLPKPALTVAELRDPIGHDLPYIGAGLPCYFTVGESATELDDRVVRFSSTKLTLAEFIRSIEEQTPLRHRFHACGNAGESILGGQNCAMGLSFQEPDR